MRSIFIVSICLLSQSCEGFSSRQVIETVEIGSTFQRVIVDSTGEARFFVDERTKTQRTGSFKLPPGDFVRLIDRLEAYRSEAKPTKQAIESFLNTTCPRGVLQVTDQGTLSIRWTGPRYDRALFADLGCDYRRHERRNREVLGILQALPLPQSTQSLP